MRFTAKIKLWFDRIYYFEYWPWWVFYLPTLLYGFYLSARARTFMYFTAVNPCMANSGVVGFSKYDILKRVPQAYVPKTIYFSPLVKLEELQQKLDHSGIQYPFILKPDTGERGRGVELIENEQRLRIYLSQNQQNFMLQEYVDHEIEMGIFYYRKPQEEKGHITSVVYKKYLSVTGDGKRTLRQLVQANTRAAIRYDYLKNKYAEEWFLVPKKGEVIKLEPIGNHMRGTEFLNGEFLINDELETIFDKIAREIDGFHYGRFDLKVPSFDHLYAGEDIMIMELNGVSAEPAHIFARDVNLFKAYKIIGRHMKLIYEIGMENHKNGHAFMPFSAFWELVMQHFRKEIVEMKPVDSRQSASAVSDLEG